MIVHQALSHGKKRTERESMPRNKAAGSACEMGGKHEWKKTQYVEEGYKECDKCGEILGPNGRISMMGKNEKIAENPAQPSGWAVDKGDDSKDAEENKSREKQKEKDQAAQADEDNREPDTKVHEVNSDPNDYKYPTASVVARVFTTSTRFVPGSKVLLRDKLAGTHSSGIIEADGDEEFAVRWSDDELTVESKSDFQLVNPEGE